MDGTIVPKVVSSRLPKTRLPYGTPAKRSNKNASSFPTAQNAEHRKVLKKCGSIADLELLWRHPPQEIANNSRQVQ